jgi:hypothetical protein
MKNLFTLLSLSCFLNFSSQTPRLCLFEAFTGETCPPTAAYNPALNNILAQPGNASRIVAICWEVPIPSAPTTTWSLYQTNKAEIDWRYKPQGPGYGYGVNFSPCGLIDGQPATAFGGQSNHVAALNNTLIAAAQSYTSAFSTSITREWNATCTSVQLTISIIASANFVSTGPLVWRTVMTERNVNFSVAPGSTGEKHFEHVAIKSFPTLQGGMQLPSAWSLGDALTFTLNCPLPSYVRDKSEIEFVGFIQDDGNRKVAQTCLSKADPLPKDAKLGAFKLPVVNCAGSVYSPSVSVINHGAEVINSFTVSSILNSYSLPPVLWNGNLDPGDTVVLSLGSFSSFPLASGGNSISSSISSVGGTDNNLVNNSGKTSFLVPFEIVEITADREKYCEGEKVVLTVSGTNDYLWMTGSTLGSIGQTAQVGMFVSVLNGYNTHPECLKTVIYNVVVEKCTGIEASGNESLNGYPNPAADVFNLGMNSAGTIIITNSIGQRMLEMDLPKGPAALNIDSYTSGLYTIHVKQGNSQTMLKFVKL